MRVAVVGAGAWGTTLSILLAEKKHTVDLWMYEKDLAVRVSEFRENKAFLPGFQLPETINITRDVHLVKNSEIIFMVIPTQFLRATAKQFAKEIASSSIVVCASKGIEEGTQKLPLVVLEEELKNTNLCALSGPNLSKEIAQGLPAATVIAAKDEAIAKRAQAALMIDRFRVYTNTDVIGVQLGGALKNVIALAAGVVDGLGLGANAKSALMVRGMAEITRLGAAMGAKIETFSGLSGMGDLITTCSSTLSRNHRVGELVAKGQKLEKILKNMKEVAEGIPTTAAAKQLGQKMKISLPITEEVYQVLYQGKDPYKAISDLMRRAAKNE